MDTLYATLFIMFFIGVPAALVVWLGRGKSKGMSDTIGDSNSYQLDHISRDGGAND